MVRLDLLDCSLHTATRRLFLERPGRQSQEEGHEDADGGGTELEEEPGVDQQAAAGEFQELVDLVEVLLLVDFPGAGVMLFDDGVAGLVLVCGCLLVCSRASLQLENPVQWIVVVWVFVGDEVEHRHEPDMGRVQGQEPDGKDLPDVEIDLVAGFVVHCDGPPRTTVSVIEILVTFGRQSLPD